MALYAMGDLQGCASAFDRLLERIDFDPAVDELWLVGDLVNRGPGSLDVLRRVRALETRVTTVLGNHDLHLLAVAAGLRPLRPKDTLQSVLDAPDAAELIDWLRARPLLHFDRNAQRVLVHAGIPPRWSVDEAIANASEVERALRGDAWVDVLAGMYGDEPRAASSALSPEAQRRYTINALTRMRFCTEDGRLDLECSGAPGTQATGLVPWFDVRDRAAADVHIVFGHWSALGVLLRPDVTALDSGCVWGRALTAMRLDPPGQPIAVDCG